MKKLHLFLIVLGVIAFHLLLISALYFWKPSSGREAWKPPQDEFGRRTITYVNDATGYKKVVQEFTVSTRLHGEEQNGKPSELAGSR